jgi:hypothetical protein
MFEPTLRCEGSARRSLSGGGCVDPSIDATRTKKGIWRDKEVQKENVVFSIVLNPVKRLLVMGDVDPIRHSIAGFKALRGSAAAILNPNNQQTIHALTTIHHGRNHRLPRDILPPLLKLCRFVTEFDVLLADMDNSSCPNRLCAWNSLDHLRYE